MSPLRSPHADPPRPTLRQLGADLKSGLARVLRHPAPVAETSAPDPADTHGQSIREAAADALADDRVSPALRAAIEARRDAMVAMLIEADTSDDTTDRLVAVVSASDDALCAVPAQSLADVRAKLAFLLPEILPDVNGATPTAFLENVFDDVERLAAPPDLSGAPIRHLARLYDLVLAVEHAVSNACNAPMAWDERRENHSAVGDLLDAEADHLFTLAGYVVAEIRARVPASTSERDDRLTTLIKRDLDVNSEITDRGLVLDLVAAWGR